jgi:translation initiation factor 3 subunit G
MSTARWGKKWADVDEDEDEGFDTGPGKSGSRFETKADAQGIKTVIEYTERDGATYRVTRKIRQTVNTKWISAGMIERQDMAKFGKALTNSEADERTMCVKSVEEVNIEFTKKVAVDLSQRDDAEDKFFEESLALTESLMREKKVWTDINKEMKEVGIGEEDKKEGDDKKPAAADTLPAPGAPGKYVPPSIRAAAEGGKGTGKDGKKGKGGFGDQAEASLRVFNLSDDVKEGDLQDLFGQCGRLQRVFLAKDMTTFQSKGFAFITYYNREDAQRAIDKLNGHGYDNLIMKVEWAKPRA